MDTFGRLLKLGVFLCLLVLSLGFVAGCDGHSGSSGTLPGEEVPVGTESTTTVKTKLALSYNFTKSFAKSMALGPADSETIFASAAVTLTLPDGRTFVMSYDGNGEYSCVVADLADGNAGYIEAEVEQMVLKNFFDDLAADDGVLDTGETGADSTFVFDVLTSFAEVLKGSSVTVGEMLNGIEGATLNIDVSALKATATDGTNPDYELARRTYQSTLSWDNLNLTSGEITGLLATDPVVNLFDVKIPNGGVVPPVGGTVASSAKSTVRGFLTVLLKDRQLTALGAYLDSADFMWGGRSKAAYLSHVSDKWNSDPVFTNLAGVDPSNIVLSVTAATDFTSRGLTMYQVMVSGTVDFTYTGGLVLTRSLDFNAPLFVADTGGGWAIFGDQKKVSIDYNLAYFNEGNSAMTEVNLYGESGSTAPSSVYLSFPDLDLPTYQLYQSPDHPQTFYFSLRGAPDLTWNLEHGNGVTSLGMNFFDLDGQRLVLTVNFPDDSVETFERVLDLRSPVTTLRYLYINLDGSVEIGWRPPLVSEDFLRVEVEVVGTSHFYVLPSTDRSLVIPASAFVDGMDYDIEVSYITTFGKYSYRKHFTYYAGGSLTVGF